MKDIIRKIEKLLALSKSPNENEAVAALSKAMRILHEHNLSMDDFEKTLLEYKKVRNHCRKVQWRQVLFQTVGVLNYCVPLWSRYSDGYHDMEFHGRNSNVITATLMFTYLEKTVTRICKQNVSKRAKQKYRDSFKLGIVLRVQDRVSDIINDDSRQKEIQKIQKVLSVSLKEKKIKYGNTNALSKGYDQGQNISLNRQIKSRKKSNALPSHL